MTDYALMFDVLDGGVSKPISWDKDNLEPDRSIIILDESTMSLFLWHGKRQGLVQRRTALRQAQSLKGHGYKVGKSIIGREIKEIKEIDSRKVGRVPETDELNDQLQKVLNKDFTEGDGHLVTFGASEPGIAKPKEKPKAEEPKAKPAPKKEKKVAKPKAPELKAKPKPKAKPAPKKEKKVAKPKAPEPKAKPKPKPKVAEPKTASSEGKEKKPKKASDLEFASEYESNEPLPTEEKLKEKQKLEVEVKPARNIGADARIAFLIRAVLDYFDDIWVSKKPDGSYSIEMMDGPVCQFSIKGSNKLKFSGNSFSGIDPKVKSNIQDKYKKLTKLL
ncbi:MAG: hypothetical protein R6U96_09865 [Promethearchaeia archaeon]